jgi:hypothetical protein
VHCHEPKARKQENGFKKLIQDEQAPLRPELILVGGEPVARVKLRLVLSARQYAAPSRDSVSRWFRKKPKDTLKH